MKTPKFLLAALMLFSVVATSCQKDEDINDPKDVNRAAVDNAKAENSFADLFKQASDGMMQASETVTGNRAMYSSLSGTATLTIDPFDLTTFPKTVTLDFGSTNVLCNDGNYRRGKIVMVATGWYHDSLSVITVTPDSYYVNDNLVEGLESFTCNGHNAAGHMNHDVYIDGTVTGIDGSMISYHSERNYEWIEGELTTLNPWDDVYLIHGTANGTNIYGEDYTMTVTTPLRVQAGCRWITAGILVIESNGNQMIVDYGDGNCDGLVTVTINGNIYNINV